MEREKEKDREGEREEGEVRGAFYFLSFIISFFKNVILGGKGSDRGE
jgi:hypothetical protein